MVGLSILLESQKNKNKSPQVLNKTTMSKPSPSPSPSFSSSSSSSSKSSSLYSPSPLPAITFLEACFLCKQRLLPGKDIYMYKGDRAFCSVECRCRQILMDEESVSRENCSFSAMKPTSSTSASAAPHRKRTRDRAGGFAY